MSKQIVKKKILSADKGIKEILSKGTQRNQNNFHEEIKEGEGKERKRGKIVQRCYWRLMRGGREISSISTKERKNVFLRNKGKKEKLFF